MSQSGGCAGGDEGQEDSAAAGPFSFSLEPTLEDIRRLHAEFAAERDWEQFHQPRNLLLALMGEVGDLAELFQWKSDAEPGPQAWLPKEGAALQEELSDVLIYLVALAARCRVDLPRAVIAKWTPTDDATQSSLPSFCLQVHRLAPWATKPWGLQKLPLNCKARPPT
ncbi:hypothetical protein ACRRTK_005875 [Alexandromys fortis]